MLLVSDDFGQASLPGLWANSGSVSVLSSGFDSPLANPPVFPLAESYRGPQDPVLTFAFAFIFCQEMKGVTVWSSPQISVQLHLVRSVTLWIPTITGPWTAYLPLSTYCLTDS